MEFGVHLPLMEWQGEGQSLTRLQAAVDAAGITASTRSPSTTTSSSRRRGSTVSGARGGRRAFRENDACDHILTRFAARPYAAAKAIAALDIPSDGRVTPASAQARRSGDYEAIGLPFDDAGLGHTTSRRRARSCGPCSGTRARRPQAGRPAITRPRGDPLAPPPRRDSRVPLWIGSWGSEPGLRRVARLADGWLASATTRPARSFAAARELLGESWRTGGRSRSMSSNSRSLLPELRW